MELVSTFIGMTFGAVYILYMVIPIIFIINKMFRSWIREVTDGEHEGNNIIHKWYRKYFKEEYDNSVKMGWGLPWSILYIINLVGVLMCKFPDSGKGWEPYTTMDAFIHIFYVIPSHIGAFLTIPLLVITTYYGSTWGAKWVYSLSTKIKKLEETSHTH